MARSAAGRFLGAKATESGCDVNGVDGRVTGAANDETDGSWPRVCPDRWLWISSCNDFAASANELAFATRSLCEGTRLAGFCVSLITLISGMDVAIDRAPCGSQFDAARVIVAAESVPFSNQFRSLTDWSIFARSHSTKLAWVGLQSTHTNLSSPSIVSEIFKIKRSFSESGGNRS